MEKLILLVLVTFLYQINVFGQQEMTSTIKTVKSTSINLSNTSVEINSIASLSEKETDNRTTSTIAVTESVRVTTASSSTSDIPDYNSTTTVVDRKTTNEETNTTAVTVSVRVTTASSITSNIPDYNPSTAVDDRDSTNDHTIQTIHPFTKAVMIIVCITYFGLFLLCSVGVCVRKINAKPSHYSVVYSHPRNDRDDTVLLMENMY